MKRYYLRAVCASTKSTFAADIAEVAKINGEKATYEKSFPSTFVFRDLPKPRKIKCISIPKR